MMSRAVLARSHAPGACIAGNFYHLKDRDAGQERLAIACQALVQPVACNAAASPEPIAAPIVVVAPTLVADLGMRVGMHGMGGSRGSAANMWTVGCNSRWAPLAGSTGRASAS